MTAPFATTHQLPMQPVVLGADSNTNVYQCPRAGVVSAVTYATLTAITGANTNTRSVSLVNKGTAGTGTTVVATLEFDSGVNSVANVPKAITLGVAANLVVAAGEVLQWQSTHVGTGIADPGGLMQVTIAASYA